MLLFLLAGKKFQASGVLACSNRPGWFSVTSEPARGISPRGREAVAAYWNTLALSSTLYLHGYRIYLSRQDSRILVPAGRQSIVMRRASVTVYLAAPCLVGPCFRVLGGISTFCFGRASRRARLALALDCQATCLIGIRLFRSPSWSFSFSIFRAGP